MLNFRLTFKINFKFQIQRQSLKISKEHLIEIKNIDMKSFQRIISDIFKIAVSW